MWVKNSPLFFFHTQNDFDWEGGQDFEWAETSNLFKHFGVLALLGVQYKKKLVEA